MRNGKIYYSFRYYYYFFPPTRRSSSADIPINYLLRVRRSRSLSVGFRARAAALLFTLKNFSRRKFNLLRGPPPPLLIFSHGLRSLFLKYLTGPDLNMPKIAFVSPTYCTSATYFRLYWAAGYRNVEPRHGFFTPSATARRRPMRSQTIRVGRSDLSVHLLRSRVSCTGTSVFPRLPPVCWFTAHCSK